MIKELKREFNNASFAVTGLPLSDAIQYKRYGIEIRPALFSKHRRYDVNLKSKSDIVDTCLRFKIMLKIKICLEMCKFTIWATIFRKLKRDFGVLIRGFREAVQEYIDADLIVCCGGEYIVDESSHFTPSFLLSLYEIYFGLLLRKPTVICAQSVGPFNNKLASLLSKWVLNKIPLITLRENISKKYLDELNLIFPQIVVTADVAFLLEPVSKEKAIKLLTEKIKTWSSPIVGITLLRWGFPTGGEAREMFTNYLNSVIQAVNYLIRVFDATVLFLPQVIGPGNASDDRFVYAQIKDKFHSTKEKVHFLTEDYAPEELMGIIGCMDIFIGSRMHSNIFALTMNVPTIAIKYRHKTIGMMKMLGLEEFTVNINSISADNLINNINKIWDKRKAIQKYLPQKIEMMKKESKRNVQLIKEFWEKNRLYEN